MLLYSIVQICFLLYHNCCYLNPLKLIDIENCPYHNLFQFILLISRPDELAFVYIKFRLLSMSWSIYIVALLHMEGPP